MYDTSKRCATYKIDRFLYYIFSRNQIVFQSTFQNLKGSIYLCFHCTDGDSQFICDLLVLESFVIDGSLHVMSALNACVQQLMSHDTLRVE